MPAGLQEADLHDRIRMLRATQKAWQAEARNCEELEVAAMAAEQTAVDAQRKARAHVETARRAVHDLAGEIDVLLDEVRLIPE